MFGIGRTVVHVLVVYVVNRSIV